MKATVLALLASASLSPAAEWITLSGIGDQIELKEGEVALLVSTSDRSYMKIEKPGTESLGLDVRPYRHDHRLYVGKRSHDPDVRISWRRPFPVAGPCVIELRSPSVVTLRHLGASDRGR